jgi:hypothetical protein
MQVLLCESLNCYEEAYMATRIDYYIYHGLFISMVLSFLTGGIDSLIPNLLKVLHDE